MQHYLLHLDERQYVTFSLKGQTTNTSQHVEFFDSLIFGIFKFNKISILQIL